MKFISIPTFIILNLSVCAVAFVSDPSLEPNECRMSPTSFIPKREPNHHWAFWKRPVANQVTSCYGPRLLLGRYGDFHEGIDFGAPKHTPVHAVARGQVLWRGWAGCSGNTLILGHTLKGGRHVLSIYRHLDHFSVKPNDKVRPGSVIAFSGESGKKISPRQSTLQRGCITRAHLHLEMKFVKPGFDFRNLARLLKRTHGHLADTTQDADPALFLKGIPSKCAIHG